MGLPEDLTAKAQDITAKAEDLTTRAPPQQLHAVQDMESKTMEVQHLGAMETEGKAAELSEMASSVVAPFVHRWVDLMVYDGATAVVLAQLDDLTTFYTTLGVTGISCLVLFAMMWWIHTRHGTALKKGERTVGELCGLTAFRSYTGMLMCTWLPFVLAEEGDNLWPAHQSIFMGIAKLILAIAMILCPIFGLMNDETLHRWGRRRSWFLGGVLLITGGIALCAFASMQKWPILYLVGTAVWCIGEAAAESTTEALIPDLCIPEDYTRAAAIRSIMFMVGGFVGYGLILVTAAVFKWNQSVFYIYYIVFILVAAPWSLHYASPTDAEKRALERLNDPSSATRESLLGQEQVPGDARTSADIVTDDTGKSYFQRCYVDCYNAGPAFKMCSIATVFMSAGTSGMMFVILVLRDLVQVESPAEQQVHMALVSMCLMVVACITSVGVGFSGINGR